MFNNIDSYLFPVQVEQSSGMVVTYFWEIKVAEINGEIFANAEEKSSFDRKVRWEKFEQPSKEHAVLVMQDICKNLSK